jgi:F1F0 ATPase subunit 2
MRGSLDILLPAIAGVALGTFYYGGLWFTLKQLTESRQPALLTIVSYFLRLALCIAMFYFIVRGGEWERLLVSLGGFLIIRTYIIYRLGPQTRQVPQESE